jgi:hypothetical protein
LKGCGAQLTAETKNKKREKGSEQERRNKRGQGQEKKERERLYYNSTQLAHFALGFFLYTCFLLTCALSQRPATCTLSKEKDTVTRNTREGENSG